MIFKITQYPILNSNSILDSISISINNCSVFNVNGEKIFLPDDLLQKLVVSIKGYISP